MPYTRKEYDKLIANLSTLALVTGATAVSEELLFAATQLSLHAPFKTPEEVAHYAFNHRSKGEADVYSPYYNDVVIPAFAVISREIDACYPTFATDCQDNLHFT